MNNKKTTLKGFTLIELIIVLAIFSVIMTLVMSFIDPVSRLMTKTSVRERTAAYVDNIGEYVSKSIRHAQNINVYEHGLTGDEATIVRDFVDTYYNGAIDENYKNMTGKVHVLKLINEDEGSLQAGRIYESVYKFTAGNGVPKTVYFDPSPGVNDYVEESEITLKLSSFRAMHSNDDDEKKSWSDNDILTKEYKYTALTKIVYDSDDKHSKIFENPGDPKPFSENVSVINEEHFKNYSYYYQLGMCTFDPIKNAQSFSLNTLNDKYFYSRVNLTEDSSNSVNEYQFVMNVISSMNSDVDKDGKFDNIVKCPATETTEEFVAFRSPASMNAVGMTFKNVQMQKESKSVKYYRKVLDSAGNVLDESKNIIPEGSTATPAIEAVTNNLGAKPFIRITEGTSRNIYIIFTVPTEINDTKWSNAAETEPTTTSAESAPAPTIQEGFGVA